MDERKIQYTAVPRPYVVRGYDAGGKLIYTSPLNGLELFAEENACYLDPAGRKVVGWSSRNPHPDPKTCRRTVTWNWLGR